MLNNQFVRYHIRPHYGVAVHIYVQARMYMSRHTHRHIIPLVPTHRKLVVSRSSSPVWSSSPTPPTCPSPTSSPTPAARSHRSTPSSVSARSRKAWAARLHVHSRRRSAWRLEHPSHKFQILHSSDPSRHSRSTPSPSTSHASLDPASFSCGRVPVGFIHRRPSHTSAEAPLTFASAVISCAARNAGARRMIYPAEVEAGMTSPQQPLFADLIASRLCHTGHLLAGWTKCEPAPAVGILAPHHSRCNTIVHRAVSRPAHRHSHVLETGQIATPTLITHPVHGTLSKDT